MFRADAAPGGRLEVELEERVVLLGPGLAREDEHAVPGHGDGEVTAGGGALAGLAGGTVTLHPDITAAL